MKTHEPYDENRPAHQKPFQAISAWQQWNDVTGGEATADALLLERLEAADKRKADLPTPPAPTGSG